MAQARLARGEPLPPAWLSKPTLLPDLAPIWNAWQLLSAFRGTSELRSPSLSVVELLEVLAVPSEQRPRWVRLLAAMEMTFTDEMLQSSKQEAHDDDGTA